MLNTWQRVNRRRLCPVCGKPDWCLYAGTPEAPTAAICPRTPSARRAGDAGFLHLLRPRDPQRRQWAFRVSDGGQITELSTLVAQCRLPPDSARLQWLAEYLGLSPQSLWRLHVGWWTSKRCWTFPMRDPHGVVVGVRLRTPAGRKLSVRGGKEGLFIPDGLPTQTPLLLVCEGPTDSAAALDLGFAAIGRPSCTGGVRYVVDLVEQLRPAEIAVVADADEPGRRGGEALAMRLTLLAITKLVVPPPPYGDLRAWRRAGAIGADVERLLKATDAKGLKTQVRIVL